MKKSAMKMNYSIVQREKSMCCLSVPPSPLFLFTLLVLLAVQNLITSHQDFLNLSFLNLSSSRSSFLSQLNNLPSHSQSQRAPRTISVNDSMLSGSACQLKVNVL